MRLVCRYGPGTELRWQSEVAPLGTLWVGRPVVDGNVIEPARVVADRPSVSWMLPYGSPRFYRIDPPRIFPKMGLVNDTS